MSRAMAIPGAAGKNMISATTWPTTEISPTHGAHHPADSTLAPAPLLRQGGEVLPLLIVKGNAERGHETLTLMRA